MEQQGSLRIVAIDANECDLQLISRELANYADLRLSTFSEIGSATNFIADRGADLVLLGLCLPADVGLDCLQRLQDTFGPNLPVIMVTGREDFESYRQVIKAGAQDCICKDRLDGRQLYSSIHNAIERQDLQHQLRKAALADAMTGLPNRVAILAEIDARLKETQRSQTQRGQPFSVLFLDIDDFKSVNDGHGHAFGDRFLLEFLKRVRGCLTPEDSLARFGGDEFVLMLPGVSSDDEVQSFMAVLKDSLKQPLVIDGNKVSATVSVGVVTSNETHRDAGQILSEADMAMFEAKIGGKSRYVRFDNDMRDAAIRRLDFERALGQAVENQELTLHYQPLVNIENGRTHGFEALVRWQHLGAMVPPLEFIAVAERTGAIHRIGAWVLETACRQMSHWAEISPEVNLSVNVSPVQLEQVEFVDEVLTTLATFEIDPRRITLEVTESVAIKDCSCAIAKLNLLRIAGIRISIDDFGTGHSSLSQLHKLPFDEIKIDRSFTKDIENQDSYSKLFVETIHTLASGIGLSMIAEGIETEGQRKLLVDCGYRLGQGYLFARPMAAAEATALLASNRLLYCGAGSIAPALLPSNPTGGLSKGWLSAMSSF